MKILLRSLFITAIGTTIHLSAPAGNHGEGKMGLVITSPAFSQNGAIPEKYTCDGKDTSPPLQWSGVPSGTRSLALIVDDPDAPDPAAPKMTWVHWVLYNIPIDSQGLGEAVSPSGLPAGTLQGVNDWKRTGYGGPCPPIGRHRYFFKLYALDTLLSDLKNPTKAALEQAMQGHILGQTELLGTYQR
jgi:Raf kinase inhibitor-like YbhB/YbcL family protein